MNKFTFTDLKAEKIKNCRICRTQPKVTIDKKNRFCTIWCHYCDTGTKISDDNILFAFDAENVLAETISRWNIEHGTF